METWTIRIAHPQNHQRTSMQVQVIRYKAKNFSLIMRRKGIHHPRTAHLKKLGSRYRLMYQPVRISLSTWAQANPFPNPMQVALFLKKPPQLVLKLQANGVPIFNWCVAHHYHKARDRQSSKHLLVRPLNR